jgi:hypothetical protein
VEEFEPRLCLSAVTFGPPTAIDGELWLGERGEGDPVYAADLDGDHDLDVLAATDFGPAWYENSDGAGSFGPAEHFDPEPLLAYTVHAADLDNDGDLDVLSCLHLEDYVVPIVWYENTDGAGTFGPRQIAAEGGGDFLHTPDLDGDGDVDLLWGAHARSGWYENMDGEGSFGSMHTLGTDRDPGAADFDGDGDVDVLIDRARLLVWLENTDGGGDFGIAHQIGERTGAIDVADFDNDGDADVLAGFAGTVVWHENTGGTFITGHPVTQDGVSLHFVRAGDVDNDGDADVVATLRGSRQIVWYENIDGQGNFAPLSLLADNTDLVWSLHLPDLDGDGDLDVLTATTDGEIVWYEQLFQQLRGDANHDGVFNQLDIVQVSQNGKYLTGEPAVWEDGDWNSDAVFDQMDIVMALQTGSYGS